jgi:hypothetical protein
MTRFRFIIIVPILFIVGISVFLFYYFHPRVVPFQLTMEMDKPYLNFDRTYYVGFDYVMNKEQLMFFFVAYYKKMSCIKTDLKGYDSIFVQNFSKELDFKKYDYIITYQKRLKSLTYSPYLAKKWDGCAYLDKKPLIPTFDTILTDKVYLYQIKKNTKYRAPGP